MSADRKYILNAEMLGGFEVGDTHGNYETLSGGTSGSADTLLASGVNNANIISAINSAYNAASGNEPQGPAYSLQAHNPNGEFSGSAAITMTPAFGGASQAIAVVGASTTFDVAAVSSFTSATRTVMQSGISVNDLQGLSSAGKLVLSVSGGDQYINMLLGDVTGSSRLVVRDAVGSAMMDVDSDGNLGVSGSITGLGSGDIAGALDVGGLTTLSGMLVVVDEATFNETVDMDSSLNVDGAATMAAITADGAIDFSSTLNVDGASTMAAITSDGAISTTSTLNADGAVTLGAPGVATDIQGTLSVDQAASFDLTLNVDGASTMAAITADGAIDFSSTLNVDGASTMAAITADGAVSFTSTLGVTDTATFTALSVHNDGATFNSQGLAACGAISGATTIDASGLATVAGVTSSALIYSSGADEGFKLKGNNASGVEQDYTIKVDGGVLVIAEVA